MMGRQEWMRNFFQHEGYAPADFVGSYAGAPLIEKTRGRIVSDLRALLILDESWAASCKTVAEALRTLKVA